MTKDSFGTEFWGPDGAIFETPEYRALHKPLLNPHLSMTRISPKGQVGIFQCSSCGAFGDLEAMGKTGCPHLPGPCSGCGLTPICAPDCPACSAAIGLAEGKPH